MKEDYDERMAPSNRPPLQATVKAPAPLIEVGPPARFTIAREAKAREADEHHRPGRRFRSSDDEVSAAAIGIDGYAPTPEIHWSREAIVSVGWRSRCGPGGYAGLGGGQFRFVCPVAKCKSKAGQVDYAASCGDNVATYLFKGHDIAGPRGA